MPIGGGPGQSRWLSAIGDWLGDQSKNIQENYNLDKISNSLIEDDGFAAPMNKAAGYTIKGLSQVARPIAGIGGALGNVMSEAGSERLAGENREMPSVLEAAMTEQATGPKTLRETLTPIDVAGIAAGGVAGATAKALPKVARIAGLADLGLSGADAALGAGDVKQGAEQGDLARVGMGVFRVAGNAYGGTKAAQALKELGIKVPDVEADTPHWNTSIGDGRKTRYRTDSPEGNQFQIRSDPETKDQVHALAKNKYAMQDYGELADYVHSVGKAMREDGIYENVRNASSANFVDDLTDEAIQQGEKQFAGFNFGGTREYGSTFMNDPQKPFFLNPTAVAKRVRDDLSVLIEKDVDPAVLEKALATVPEDLATYVRGIRAGETRVPEIESRLATERFLRSVSYTAAHEPIGHWKGTHRQAIIDEADGDDPFRKITPEYKDLMYATDGTQFEAYPKQISLDDPKASGMTLFEPAHNAVVTALNDPGRLRGLKAQMMDPEFMKRAQRWYERAGSTIEDPVAKRSDRVIGRAETAAIQREEAGGQAPTPPDSVPPGSSGGAPQGPELPSLAKRIKQSLKANGVAANQNDMKMRQLNKLRAEALRDNEAKYAGQQISTEEFHAQRAAIKSGTYGLIEKVQQMPITEAEKAMLTEQISTQAADDAFIRDRTQTAMQKMIAGERLQDNEIKLIRETIGERLRINEEDPAILKLGKFFANATGSARALMTAYDLSAAGRQALYAGVMNPKAVKEAFVTQIKALRMTRPEFDSMMARLKDPMYNPFAEVSEAAGLHFSETMAHATGKQEEAFYNGKWAESLPGVRQSEQAYIAYLNKIRVEIFNKHAKVIMDSGEELIDPMTGTASQKMQDLAYMVNTLTGRGEMSILHMSPNSPLGKRLGLKETYSPGATQTANIHQALTTVFFAPRFAASRAALMRDTVQAMIGGGLDPAISKIYMKNVVGTITAVTSTMAALAAMGVGTFNSDPRKKDFGVLKVGNTRYDGYGGLKQWAKIVSLIGQDQYFSGKYNVKTEYGKKFGSKTKTGEVGRFVQGKLSPASGFLLEALTGEDFMGRKSQLMRNAYEHSFPMVIQTIAEAVEANEADQLPLAVPLSMVGVGVNSYSDARFKKGSR